MKIFKKPIQPFCRTLTQRLLTPRFCSISKLCVLEVSIHFPFLLNMTKYYVTKTSFSHNVIGGFLFKFWWRTSYWYRKRYGKFCFGRWRRFWAIEKIREGAESPPPSVGCGVGNIWNLFSLASWHCTEAKNLQMQITGGISAACQELLRKCCFCAAIYYLRNK